MSVRPLRLNFNILWVLSAATGLANNWLLRSYGLNTIQRTYVVLCWLPLLIFLVAVCVLRPTARQK
jgi:hypothetical protein